MWRWGAWVHFALFSSFFKAKNFLLNKLLVTGLGEVSQVGSPPVKNTQQPANHPPYSEADSREIFLVIFAQNPNVFYVQALLWGVNVNGDARGAA